MVRPKKPPPPPPAAAPPQSTSSEFLRMHGDTIDDCVALLDRRDVRDRRFDPEHDESWLVRLRGRVATVLDGGCAWLTGLWVAPSGRAFVAGVWPGRGGGGLYALETGGAGGAPAACVDDRHYYGVWGLSETLAFAWGFGARREPLMAVWDGATWRDVPSPGTVFGMHGLRPDLIFAVGDQGLVARWDGAAWHRLASPTAGTLNAVVAEADGTAWATGLSGDVLEGSEFGWARRARATEPFHRPTAIARWRGEVWLGDVHHGLFALVGDRLEPRAKYPRARHMHTVADDRLLVVGDRSLTEWTTPTVYRAAVVTVAAAALPPWQRR